MATRILASWYLLGQDSDYPATNFDSWDPLGKGEHVDVRANHRECVREPKYKPGKPWLTFVRLSIQINS